MIKVFFDAEAGEYYRVPPRFMNRFRHEGLELVFEGTAVEVEARFEATDCAFTVVPKFQNEKPSFSSDFWSMFEIEPVGEWIWLEVNKIVRIPQEKVFG
ncbi:hypothetical protein [Risungbinella massiliensis]|uniref:hypothetical protein n=1 Tax=Risungbinella massiliensis TaxID=1329796 RepID=UPI0005CC4617|nr:hypothetical protein [Risungbinella massiliensis]